MKIYEILVRWGKTGELELGKDEFDCLLKAVGPKVLVGKSKDGRREIQMLQGGGPLLIREE